jgi:predicted XRE-type DNA-binding protein
MSQRKRFQNVWEALEDDLIRAENLKLRSKLMIEINTYINKYKLKQTEAAKILRLSPTSR